MTMEMRTPGFGEDMAPANPSREARNFLRLRRSTSVERLGAPGPDPSTLADILETAARVPDHRRVFPFRFIVIEGDARARAGEALRAAFLAGNPGAEPEAAAVEARRFLRAPVVVAVISKVDRAHRTPEWEQVLTCGAACFQLLLAANANGFAGNWLTEWYAYDPAVSLAFGLSADERFAGFVYLGTAIENPKERQRPVMSTIVSRF